MKSVSAPSAACGLADSVRAPSAKPRAAANIFVLLLGGNRLRQRPDDGRDDVRVHQLLANAALVVIRLGKFLVGRPTPVLPDGEIDADRRLRELAGADLVSVRPRLDAEP